MFLLLWRKKLGKCTYKLPAQAQVLLRVYGSSSLLVVKSVIMNKIRKRYFIVNNLIYSDILSI